MFNLSFISVRANSWNWDKVGDFLTTNFETFVKLFVGHHKQEIQCKIKSSRCHCEVSLIEWRFNSRGVKEIVQLLCLSRCPVSVSTSIAELALKEILMNFSPGSPIFVSWNRFFPEATFHFLQQHISSLNLWLSCLALGHLLYWLEAFRKNHIYHDLNFGLESNLDCTYHTVLPLFRR